jgi:hypothetical protein
MPKFDHRFARQNGGGPPPEFPLASSYPGIVHHLSGPNIYALTRVYQEISRSVRGAHSTWSHTNYFHCALGFATQTLAYMLDSLVRVSRRVG